MPDDILDSTLLGHAFFNSPRLFCFALIILHDSCIFAAPPRIHVHPQAKIVEINNDSTSVTFVCMAYEASSYYWLRETGSIPSDATGVMTNKLTLHSISSLDSGHYQCVAENEQGKTYSNYVVFTVIGKVKMKMKN